MRRLIATLLIALFFFGAGVGVGNLGNRAELETRLYVCGAGWWDTMGALNGMLIRFSNVTFFEDGSYSGCVPDGLCALP